MKIKNVIIAFAGILLAYPDSLISDCRNKISMEFLSIEEWDVRADFHLKDNKIILPAKEVRGEEVFPALRPEGFKRSHFQVIHSTQPFEGDLKDVVEHDKYLITFFGKALASETLTYLLGRFYGLEIKITKDLSRTAYTSSDPPYNSDYDDINIYFESETISGRVEVLSFNDAECNEWTIVKYYFDVKKSKI